MTTTARREKVSDYEVRRLAGEIVGMLPHPPYGERVLKLALAMLNPAKEPKERLPRRKPRLPERPPAS